MALRVQGLGLRVRNPEPLNPIPETCRVLGSGLRMKDDESFRVKDEGQGSGAV